MAELTCVEHSPEFVELRRYVHDSINAELRESGYDCSENLRTYFKLSAGANEFFSWFDSIDEADKSSEECFHELLEDLRERVAERRKMCCETPGDSGDAIELWAMNWGLIALQRVADSTESPSLISCRTLVRRQPSHLVHSVFKEICCTLRQHARLLAKQLIDNEVRVAWRTDKPAYNRIQENLKLIGQDFMEIYQVLQHVPEVALTKSVCLQGFEVVLARRIESMKRQKLDPRRQSLPEDKVILQAMEITREELALG